MINDIPPEDEASIDGPVLGLLTALVVLNYLIAGAVLVEMPLSSVQRAAALFAGLALGFAGSGRVLGAVLRALFAWRQDTCMLLGSFLSHFFGACVAVEVGRMALA